MKEEYVSFEQAVALKECGFNWDCGHSFYQVSKEERMDIHPLSTLYDSKDYISAPTQALAQKWLREVKGMDIYVIPHYQNAYEVAAKRHGKVAIDTIFVFDLWDSTKPYPTYESALSAGLDAALELIKQK